MSTPGTDVATRGATTAIAIRSGQDMFDDRQVAALAVLGVKDATKADLAVYFHVCRQTGLDPFLRQIYLIARQENVRDQWITKQTIQVGIEGFRVIRDRAAKRDGVEVEYSRTIWYDGDGGEHKIWLQSGPPAGCEMTVYKNGKPYPAVLTYAEYAQTKNGQPTGKWRDAPAHQLEKCCEAFGLRRAFPHDLAGVRLDDEMAPAEDTPLPAAVRVTAEAVTTRRAPAAGPAERPAGASPADAPAPAGDPAREQTAPAAGDRPPALAASGQVSKIRTHFERLGYEDHEREERLVITALLAGASRDLESTGRLTQDQARIAIGRLNGVKDRAELHDAARRIEAQIAAAENAAADDQDGTDG